MKLLIVTQKVDMKDDVLGFFHRWIIEFAKQSEIVTVICLEKGMYDLPNNVNVYSLGKEIKQSRFSYAVNFFRYIWRERKNYDAVFVHMNPIYIVLGGILWKMMGKKIALWYTHKQVDMKLRLATHGADIVYTAAPESFKLKTQKLRVMGHGIDVQQFEYQRTPSAGVFRMVSVGRISEVKRVHVIVEAAALVKAKINRPFVIDFVGRTITDKDEAYFSKLRARIDELHLQDIIKFSGVVKNTDIHTIFARSDASINASLTGGIDKTVLESMAAGVPVIAVNRAFLDYFGEHKDTLIADETAEDLAKKIELIMTMPPLEIEAISEYLKKVARERADITTLVARIIGSLRHLS